MRNRVLRLWIPFALAGIVACSKAGACPHQIAAREPDPAACTARIRGRVRYEGTAPSNPEIRMTSECRALHAQTVADPVVVVQNGGLGNVAVWIERGLEQFTFAPPAQPAQMDNHNCLFEPRVVVVSVHGLVRFTSSDPVTHNVRWSGGNHSLPYKGSSTQAAFCSPGIEKVACDVHSWMRGYVVVAPTPYAAVSAPDGAFAFDRPLPPGTYTLVAWHETLGRKTVEVTLADGETREVVIPFP